MNRTNNHEALTTEQLILQAAEKEFMQKGYAGARTSSIAEAAGVTHAMMHYYFRTKDKLFNKIISDKMSLVREIMLGSLSDENLPLFERLRVAIERHFDFIAANPDLPRFLIGEVFGQPGRMALILDQFKSYTPGVIASLQQQINEYSRRGECRRVDASMLLLDIVSLNIFCFMAAPMINPLLDGLLSMHDFAERRKQENVMTIMRKLRP